MDGFPCPAEIQLRILLGQELHVGHPFCGLFGKGSPIALSIDLLSGAMNAIEKIKGCAKASPLAYAVGS